MKTKNSVFIVVGISIVLLSGCTGTRYNTQRGAVIGGALGAGYGAAVGRDVESTLIGTALGGLAGALIGNYHDQRQRNEHSYQGSVLESRRNKYRYAMPTPPVSGYRYGDRWVIVPEQYVGSEYVPRHQIWVPEYRSGIVVERK